MMKKTGIGLITLMLAARVCAEDVPMVVVTGDRVSLRAEPELNSVLLDRTMEGDSLVLIDDANAEWLGVFPPDSVDLWVHSEFIQDGKVIPNRLNVRSCPSLSHSVVGVMEKNQELTIRGEAGGWLRIAPPQGTVVWISRQYAQIAGAENEPAAEMELDSSAPSEMNNVMGSSTGVAELPQTLSPDTEKTQGQQITLSGLLRPVGGLLYKLVNPDIEELSICYVRGNTQQMKKLSGQELTIRGRAYWALNLDQPFVVPVKIRLSD
ncbi:MAG TPA: SH3 domain-containing protein [Tichowtungia sp.]|nr:SH3 domain-containing protein [Tichowtungia sp.]